MRVNLAIPLFKHGRRQQLLALEQRIKKIVPSQAPLIIAGDFNDWREIASDILSDTLDLTEVFEFTSGRTACSYPSILPFLRLDRIYVRGFHVKNTHIHHGYPWSKISDHAALSAKVTCR